MLYSLESPSETAMFLQTILVIFALSANLVEGASIGKEGGDTEALTFSQETDHLDDTTHYSLKTKSNFKGNYGSTDGEDMTETTINDNTVEDNDVIDEMDLDDVKDDTAGAEDNGNLLTKIFRFLMKNDVSIAEKKDFFSSMLQNLLKGTSDRTETADTSSGELKDTNKDGIDKADSSDYESKTYIAETNTVQEQKEKKEVAEVLTSEAPQADWKSSSTHMPQSGTLTSSSSSPFSNKAFDMQHEYVSVGQTTAISTSVSLNNSNYQLSRLSTDTGYQHFKPSDLNVAALQTSQTLFSEENSQISNTVTSSYVAPIEKASNVELTASTHSSNTRGAVGQLVLDSHSKLATNINTASSPETYVTAISNLEVGKRSDMPLTEMEDIHRNPKKDIVTKSVENALPLQQDKEIRASYNTTASGGPMETNFELLELVLNHTLSGLYNIDDSESNESDEEEDDDHHDDDNDDYSDSDESDGDSDESDVDDDVNGHHENDYEYDDYNNKDRRNGDANEVNTKVERNINEDVKTQSSLMRNILDDSKYFIKTENIDGETDGSFANVAYYQMMNVPKKAISVSKEYDQTRNNNVVQQGTENDEKKKNTDDDSVNVSAIGDKIEIVYSKTNEDINTFDGTESGKKKKDKFGKGKGRVTHKDKKDVSFYTDNNKLDFEENNLYEGDVTSSVRMENTVYSDNESEDKEGLFEGSKRNKSMFDKGVEESGKGNDEMNKKNRYDHDDTSQNENGRKHNMENVDIAGIHYEQTGQKGEKVHVTEEQQENNEDIETLDNTNEKKLELTDNFGALAYGNDFKTKKNEINVKEFDEKETSKENKENDNVYAVESRKENKVADDNVHRNKTEADVNKTKDEVIVQAKFVVEEGDVEAEGKIDDDETSDDKDVVMHYANELPSENKDKEENKKTHGHNDKEDDIVHTKDGARGNNVHGDDIVKTQDKTKLNVDKDKHIVQSNEEIEGSNNEEYYKLESQDQENINNDEEENEKTDDDAKVSNDNAKYFDKAEEEVKENNGDDKDALVKNTNEKRIENAKIETADGKGETYEDEDNIADADTNTRGNNEKSNYAHVKESEENDRNDESVDGSNKVTENNDDTDFPIDDGDNSKAEPSTDMDTFDDEVNENKAKNNKEKNEIVRHTNELKKSDIDDEVSLGDKGEKTIADDNIDFEDVADEKDGTEHKATDAKKIIGETVDTVKKENESNNAAEDNVYTMNKDEENDEMDLTDDYTRTDDFVDRNENTTGGQENIIKSVKTKDAKKATIDTSKDINEMEKESMKEKVDIVLHTDKKKETNGDTDNEKEKKEYDQINMVYPSGGEEISGVTETENIFSNSDNKIEESTYGQKPNYLKIESDLESTANISFREYAYNDEGVGHENKNNQENSIVGSTGNVNVKKIDEDVVYALTENNENKKGESANNVSFKDIGHTVLKVDPMAEKDSDINDDDEGKTFKQKYNYERGDGTSVNENYENIVSQGSGIVEHSDEQQLNIRHVLSGKLKLGDMDGNKMHSIKNQQGLTDMVTEITKDSVNEKSSVGNMDDYSVNADYPMIDENFADYYSNDDSLLIQDPDLNVGSKDGLGNIKSGNLANEIGYSDNQNSAVADEKWSDAEYGVGNAINRASNFYESNEESRRDQNTKSDSENEGIFGSLMKMMKGGSNSYIVLLNL